MGLFGFSEPDAVISDGLFDGAFVFAARFPVRNTFVAMPSKGFAVLALDAIPLLASLHFALTPLAGFTYSKALHRCS